MVIVDAIESPVEPRVSPPTGTMDSVIIKSNGKAVLAFMPESLALHRSWRVCPTRIRRFYERKHCN
jgi:DNA-binding IclR family transcriptional regulator